MKVYRGHTSERFCAFAAFCALDAAVACGGEDRGVRLWDLNSGALAQLLPGRADAAAPGDGHCDTVVALDAHPTRRLLASGALDADRTVKLWSAEPAAAAEEQAMVVEEAAAEAPVVAEPAPAPAPADAPAAMEG